MIEDQYLVVYTVSQPWWSTDKVLVEQFIARTNPGDLTLADVSQVLADEAKANGCRIVSAGTLAAGSSAAVLRLYERAGFRRVGYQFIREV